MIQSDLFFVHIKMSCHYFNRDKLLEKAKKIDIITVVEKKKLLNINIVIRNGKIVWKHGPYLAEF